MAALLPDMLTLLRISWQQDGPADPHDLHLPDARQTPCLRFWAWRRRSSGDSHNLIFALFQAAFTALELAAT